MTLIPDEPLLADSLLADCEGYRFKEERMRDTYRARVYHAALVGLIFVALVPAAAGAQSGKLRAFSGQGQAGKLRLSSTAPRSDGTVGKAAAVALKQGYLVPDQAAYARAKAKAAGNAPGSAQAQAAAGTLAPVTIRSWNGIFDPNHAPSDSTGSVGSTRYMELINSKFAIYNKTTNAPINAGTLNQLANAAGNAFDPQIMWDAQTSRFYYATDLVVSASSNILATGFSKTASPNNGTVDFCHYFVNFGSDFPDYPKLGDTANFLLIGANIFNAANAFIGSDAFGISKPSAGTTCPAATTFKFGEKFDLRDPIGGPAFTPVPVNQIDPSTVGYIVSRTRALPSTRFSLHRVTRNADGTPNFQSPGLPVVVPSYAIPPNAPQRTGFASSNKLLDTLDARPTQAVSAIDPGHANAVGLWVQHSTATVPAGRSEVRWYEINPVTRTLLQSGKASSTAYFAFNGAISPDRARLGTTAQFGNSMVLGFDTSGTTSFPAVRMLSKVGAAAQSAHVLVRSSLGNYSGFDCAGADNNCRWGDYAGASPDPMLPAGSTRGRVWSVSQFASGVNSTTAANWRTRNWIATP